MELKIKKIKNAFVVEWKEEIEENKFTTYQEAIVDNFNDEKEEMKSLLYWVAEFFGVSYDKWSKGNLNILYNKKGSKL